MWRLATLGIFVAFAFDWWVSLYIFHGGAGIGTYFRYLVSGLSFDIMHAIGNLTFALWLAPTLNRFPEINVKTESTQHTDSLMEA